MRTNAPTVAPLVLDDTLETGDVVFTGGMRLQQTGVEHISEHTDLVDKDGMWSTSPVGGWVQGERVHASSGPRIVFGGEYGAGWSSWLGLAATIRNPLRGPTGGVGFLVGVTRRETLYWDSTLDYRKIPDGWDTTKTAYERRYSGLHLWTRLAFAFQARGRGPWVEVAWVPLYSWGGEALDGYFSSMGSLAGGWHQPIGAQDRIVVGWRGMATGYTMSNQGMFLWQHAFLWREPMTLKW